MQQFLDPVIEKLRAVVGSESRRTRTRKLVQDGLYQHGIKLGISEMVSQQPIDLPLRERIDGVDRGRAPGASGCRPDCTVSTRK